MNKPLSQFILIFTTLAIYSLFAMTIGSADQAMIMSVASIILIISLSIAERFIPFLPEWNNARHDALGDMGMFVMVFGALDSLLKWGTPFVIIILLQGWSGSSIGLPLWQQAILAGLLIEFGAYISHFLHHKSRFLWSLHAMHHSPERLYTLNNFRFHPFNYALNHLFMIFPPLLLGLSPTAILAYVALSLPVLLLQHSNIDFRFGWMSVILNTNEAHRWHHSDKPSEGNSNFGRATLLWDHIFRTYHNPAGRNAPTKIGLFASSAEFPKAKNTIAQLLYPFSRQCCSSAK